MRGCFGLLVALVLAGCPDRTIARLDPDEAGQVQKDIPVNADIDLLFVIDNSASTSDKQKVFADNFPLFVAALDAFETGRPNLHIGVVSTTVDIGVSGLSSNCPHPAASDDGLLQNTPRVASCSPPRDRYIEDVKLASGVRQINYTGTLDQTLSCIAQLGATGCGFESPLEAMKRALDGTRSENHGFLRPGAFLAVVILTDEDDCSVKDSGLFSLAPAEAGPADFRCTRFAYQCDTPIAANTGGMYHNCRVRTDSYLQTPEAYVNFLQSIEPPGRTVVALIGGDPKTDIATGPLTIGTSMQELALLPSCHATINGSDAMGRPAIRINDFISRFGDHGLFRTVCQPDYSAALTDIGKLIALEISPCLEGDLNTDDIDANNPGTQIDCKVSYVQLGPMNEEIETPIPNCRMVDASTPAAGTDACWWVKPDAAKCSTATTLELQIEHPSPPTQGANTRVRCATTPKN